MIFQPLVRGGYQHFGNQLSQLRRPFQESMDWRHLPLHKAYVSGLCKGIFPENMAKNMVLTYIHFRILIFPLIVSEINVGIGNPFEIGVSIGNKITYKQCMLHCHV